MFGLMKHVQMMMTKPESEHFDTTFSLFKCVLKGNNCCARVVPVRLKTACGSAVCKPTYLKIRFSRITLKLDRSVSDSVSFTSIDNHRYTWLFTFLCSQISVLDLYT